MIDPRKKKILVIPSWYPPDGGYFFKEHSEALSGAGWQVDLLVTRMLGIRKILKSGLGVIHRYATTKENGLNVNRSVFLKIPGSERLNVKRRIRHIYKRYREYEKLHGKPDLILAHSVTWAGYVGYLIHRNNKIPYVIVEHRSYFVWHSEEARKLVKSFYIPYFERAYRHCSKLVLVSESQLTGLKALFNWIEERTTVIPNMIREDYFTPPSLKRRSDPFIFMWAGRLEHVKGLDILLKAIGHLGHMTDRIFTTRLAGRGSIKNQLIQEARDLGIEERVHFLGRLSRDEIKRELQNANCFVLPTRYEAFGVVLIEAMSAGLPVIATRSGGPEYIVNAENGILIDPEDPVQLSEAMKQMISNYDEYNSERIRAYTIKNYGHKNVMDLYTELFQSILKK